MKEIQKYTNEELRDELIRRSMGKSQWAYWEGKIVGIYYDYMPVCSIVFRVKSEAIKKDGKWPLGCDERNFRVHPQFGFTRSNMPKIGDKVMLRHRIVKKGYTGDIAHSKIIKVIK